MGRKPSEKDREEFLEYLRSGKDEMNLLEYSISSAGTKVDRETRSLVFVRDDVDRQTGEPVERSWRVSFSADYGRPTAIDDDVFLMCLKLSAAQNFSSRKVEFTRCLLCKMLGIGVNGKNFRALDESFNRLRGVHIVAKRCWYDNEAKSWVNRKFSIFDHVEMYDREEYLHARRVRGEKHPQSHFVWSQVMQESFDKGYVRDLDLEEYRSLSSPVARKLYRYLGKNFYLSTTHTIDIQVLGHQKLGYQAGKRNAELRRLVEPAIEELESRGMYGLSHQFNARYGKCEVVFEALDTTRRRAKGKQRPENPLVERLTKLGISRGDAAAAVKGRSAERIVEDIEHVEYEAKRGRVKSSKAGLLAMMLKADEAWPRPEGFESEATRRDRAAKLAEAKQRKVEEEKERDAKASQESEAQHEFVVRFMDSLGSDEARRAFEQEAMKQERFVADLYLRAKKDGQEAAASMYRVVMLRKAIEKHETMLAQA